LLSGALKSRAYVDIQRMPRGQCRWYRQAGRLRANSSAVAGAIQAEIPTSSWGEVSLIPNPLPFDPPEQIDLDAKQKRVLYCGRVHPEKGLEILMRSAHRLSPVWSVHVVGPWEVAQGGDGKGYLEHLKKLASGALFTSTAPSSTSISSLFTTDRRQSLFTRRSPNKAKLLALHRWKPWPGAVSPWFPT